MKKIVVSILALLIILPAKAQNDSYPQHEWSISAGVLPSTDSRMFIDVLVAVLTLGLVTPDDMTMYGSYSLEYTYHSSKRWAYGLVAGYSANKTIYKNGYKENSTKDESLRHYYYFMPTAKWTWSHKKHINFYSYAGLGLYYRNERITSLEKGNNDAKHNNGIMPALQITPIGMEFGGERLKFFTDIGFGNKGLLNAGMRYKF